MRLRDLQRMVRAAADPAFATDPEGAVVAWNTAAEQLTGVAAPNALGRPCADLIGGSDECGPFCQVGCAVRRAVTEKRPRPSYELQIRTAAGPHWCAMSAIPAELDHAGGAYALHLIRPMDARKRLELHVRSFVTLPASDAAAQSADLTAREMDVLRLLAQGCTSSAAGEQLRISKATVNNHVQRILHKLHAKTRLEAVRRAESAGLI